MVCDNVHSKIIYCENVRLMEGSVFIIVSSQVDVMALDLPTHVIQTTRGLRLLVTKSHDVLLSIVSYVKLRFEQRCTTLLTHQDEALLSCLSKSNEHLWNTSEQDVRKVK